jgi:hypothetical protein
MEEEQQHMDGRHQAVPTEEEKQQSVPKVEEKPVIKVETITSTEASTTQVSDFGIFKISF